MMTAEGNQKRNSGGSKMSRRHGIRVLGGCMLAALAVQVAQANPWTATVSGYWTNAATWGGSGTPGNDDDAAINSGVSVTVDVSTASLNTFTNNGTLMFMGWNTIVTATVVQVNGTITHAVNTSTASPWTPDNRIYIVCSNLTVAGSGTINVDGCGYQGSIVDQSRGYGPGGGSARLGAAYGGYGGQYIDTFWNDNNAVYGNAAAPVDPGSGGGGAGVGYEAGHGGGAIRIVASGEVSNAGTISANGTQLKTYGGGGSGGSIYITCRTLTGTGTLRANGGGGMANGMGGGGGRIAVSYSTSDQDALAAQPIKFSVAGGAVNGGRGTLWLSDGALLPPTLSSTFSNLRIVGFGAWSTPYLTISNTTIAFEQPGFELAVTNGNLLLTNNANLYLQAGPTNGIIAYGMRLRVSGDMTVASNSCIYPISDGTNGGSVQFVTRNLTVNGIIAANGAGYLAANTIYTKGYGPGGGFWSNTEGAYGGAGGYGGRGGKIGLDGGSTYGSSNAPIDPGSGAGFGASIVTTEGNGGGLVWIKASGNIAIAGTISANGNNSGNQWGSGGSGGGIYLTCNRFSGGGSLQATGSPGGSGGGTRGGGGGRIAVWSSVSTWSGSNSAAGGAATGGAAGDPGTAVFGQLPPRGTVISIR
jgi:hypothetical protein